MKNNGLSISRSFTKEIMLPVNKVLNNEYIQLTEFANYCSNLYGDLLVIKKCYSERFDSLSNININKYIDTFNYFYKQYLRTLCNKDYIKNLKNNNDIAVWRKLIRFDAKNFYIENLNSDIFDKVGYYRLKINNKTYEKIKSISTNIFNIEKLCANVTKSFWKDCQTDINNFNIEEPYAFFVKVMTEKPWRTLPYTFKNNIYFNNTIAVSTSYVTNQKSEFFKSSINEKIAGFIYKINNENAIICANYEDAYMQEKINGKNPLNYDIHCTPINRIADLRNKLNKHSIFANATEIATPLGLLNSSSKHNEVVLNKKDAEMVAVFYVGQNSYSFAEKLNKNYNLPIIELKQCNVLEEYGKIL